MPTYLWGEEGSGKSHLLKAVRAALREQGANVGWFDPGVHDRPEFDERWSAVLLDDVHLYSTEQQAVAFNWFVNAISPGSAQRWVLAAGSLPRPTCRCVTTCAAAWAGAMCSSSSRWTKRPAAPCCARKADARGIFLGDEVMDYMLSRFSRDLGSLMQLLGQLDAYALQTQRAITIPLLKAMLESE